MSDADRPFLPAAILPELRALAGAPEPRAVAGRLLKSALQNIRADLYRQMEAEPGLGHVFSSSYSHQMDALLSLLADFTATRLHPLGNPTSGERLAVLAVGGYGRGELAPHSDIDILFLTPGRAAPWTEQAIESMLYVLWDLGPKIGHAVRTVDEVVKSARADLTIRTAMLETRLIWGDAALYREGGERLRREVVHGTAAQFVAEKLAERAERHKRMGDSRYLVEPNLKEGKGGLRDLHTLYWIGKYIHNTDRVEDLVRLGLFTAPELRMFRRAEDFFWAVRWQLHHLTGRAEDRLTFDHQAELARRLRYADRPGNAGVERFMRHYYLHAKNVGALTGVFLTQLEEKFGSRGWLPSITRRPKYLGGFTLRRGRIGVPHDGFFREEPRRLLALFAMADMNALGIDAQTLRIARRDSSLVDDQVRQDPQANAWFMEVLTSPRNPEAMLRQMTECGVFGRFVPDFGRIVAKMQFDMYHHFTVDEHTIRAIGLLSRIERGALSSEYPLASRIAHQIASRRVLYVAMLLHDIAKGRGRDHSIVGAEIALSLGPRLGLSEGETEAVAWLVRCHLLMSLTAFKRDLTDPKTIEDFAAEVGSPERLRLLLVLTTVDISAVGPGVWNKWKGQLLGELYEAAEERLRRGHMARGRDLQVRSKQERLATTLGWSPEQLASYAARFSDSYWIAEPADVIEANAKHVTQVEEGSGGPVRAAADATTGTTQLSVYTEDAPGLFARLSSAIAIAGASIVDARIHTTNDGRALDNFVIQDATGQPFDEPHRLRRMEALIGEALAGPVNRQQELAARPPMLRRAVAFATAPVVFVSNKASNRFTVVEVGALDRPGLLSDLTHALHGFGAVIRSAHIGTVGERATDTFYLTDARGRKITDPSEVDALERTLLRAAELPEAARSAA